MPYVLLLPLRWQEEWYQANLKKGTKRRNHQEHNERLEEAMTQRIASLVRPTLSHLLVCRLVVGTVRLALSLPSLAGSVVTLIRERANPPPPQPQLSGWSLQSPLYFALTLGCLRPLLMSFIARYTIYCLQCYRLLCSYL